MRNLTNFDPTLENLKMSTSMGSFCQYHIRFQLRKYRRVISHDTDAAQKMEFSITDFFSKCDQIRRFLQIWSHLLKKSVTENWIFLQCEE